jgi:hypothetical protein
MCFTLEAREGLSVASNFQRQKLQRHEAMQARVFSLVDHPHSSATELFEDAVMRDGLAD